MSWHLRAGDEWTPDEAAIAHMAASSSTRHVRDLAQQALIVRGAKPHLRDFAISEVLLNRRSWLDYLTVQQRKWQTQHTRRPSRARHHDSLAIRERYVRVQG